MARALKVCSTSGCPHLTSSGRCEACQAKADTRRGTRQRRGYGRAHETRFRPGVLRRDPICTCDQQGQHTHGRRCYQPATVADHWPIDKRELVAQGMDSNDPAHGRGLCAACHNAITSLIQPGGWARR